MKQAYQQLLDVKIPQRKTAAMVSVSRTTMNRKTLRVLLHRASWALLNALKFLRF